MKRCLSLLLCLLILVPSMALADDPDGRTLPVGVYKVGEDIPAGRWTFSAYPGKYTSVEAGDILKDNKYIDLKSDFRISQMLTSPEYKYYDEGVDVSSFDLDLADGLYVIISYNPAIIVPPEGAVPVNTDVSDLSELSFDQLIALKEQISKELTTRPEWKEVTVPQGVWKVGEDIPAGHWTISAYPGTASVLEFGTVLDATKKEIDNYQSDFYYYISLQSPERSTFDEHSDISSDDILLTEGTYIIVAFGSVIFSPYTGKPSLGF